MSDRKKALVGVFFLFVLFLMASSTDSRNSVKRTGIVKHNQIPEVEEAQALERERRFQKEQKLRELQLRYEPEERELEALREDFKRRALNMAFTMETAKGCSSKAVFKKSLGQWRVFIPNLGSRSVSILYPKHKNKIIRRIEAIGAGDDVTVKEFDFCEESWRNLRPKL